MKIRLLKFLLILILCFSFTHIEGGVVLKNIEVFCTPPKKAISVFVTVYKYTEECRITADGSIIEDGVFWCAVSPDMISKHNLSFGDTIIYKDVEYVIHDLTHKRLTNTVDILIHDDSLFAESNLIYINNSPHGNKN